MSDEASASMGRRRFIGGALAASAVTAASSGAAATGAGSADAGDDPSRLFQENGNETDGNETDGNGTGDGEPTVEVIEMHDNYFEPDDLTIQPETTVRWEWVGSNMHNVVPLSQPDESDWEGQPDLQSSGSHEYTFTVEGTYEYDCEPHPGMDGVLEVTSDPVGEPEVAPAIPEEAMTLGLATSFALVATLGFAYVFLKFGGDDRDA